MEAMNLGLIDQEPTFASSGSEVITQGGCLPSYASKNNPFEDLQLETLSKGDAILVKTRNSNYRFFLLDPESGHALVEGGRFFSEPVEAILWGSTLGGTAIKLGTISSGSHLEFCAEDKMIKTSPVLAVSVEHNLSF